MVIVRSPERFPSLIQSIDVSSIYLFRRRHMPSANNAVQKSCVLLEQIRQRRTAPNLGKEISILIVADFREFLLPKPPQLSIRNPCQSKLLPLSNAAWKTVLPFAFTLILPPMSSPRPENEAGPRAQILPLTELWSARGVVSTSYRRTCLNIIAHKFFRNNHRIFLYKIMPKERSKNLWRPKPRFQ